MEKLSSIYSPSGSLVSPEDVGGDPRSIQYSPAPTADVNAVHSRQKKKWSSTFSQNKSDSKRMKLVAGTRRTLSTELSRLETKSYLSYATTHLRSMSYFDIFHYYYSPAQARGSLWPEVGIVFARIQLWRCGHYSPLNNSWLNCTQAASNKKEKEVKRQTLLELVDYVNTSAGQKIFTEASMPVCSHVLMQDITRGYSPCV